MLKIEERAHFHKECHYSVNWGALDYRCIRLMLSGTPLWNSGKFSHVNEIPVQLLNIGNVCFTLNDIGITLQTLLLTSQRHHSWDPLALKQKTSWDRIKQPWTSFLTLPIQIHEQHGNLYSVALGHFIFLNQESDTSHFCSPDREYISVSLSAPGKPSSLRLTERRRTTCKNSLKKLVEKCSFPTFQTNKWIDQGTNSSLLLL